MFNHLLSNILVLQATLKRLILFLRYTYENFVPFQNYTSNGIAVKNGPSEQDSTFYRSSVQ